MVFYIVLIVLIVFALGVIAFLVYERQTSVKDIKEGHLDSELIYEDHLALEKSKKHKILKKSDFDLIFNEIDVSNITDLIFLPYLCGERSPINDPDAKGAFFGLNDCFQTKDLTKAVVEGVCFSLLDNYKVLEELGINVETIKVIGGGSKSKKVLQILADIFGKKIQTISTSDGGSLGAIILAMKGDKPNKSLEEIGEKIVEVKEEIYPNLKLHEKYLSKFFKYKRLYFATKNIL